MAKNKKQWFVVEFDALSIGPESEEGFHQVMRIKAKSEEKAAAKFNQMFNEVINSDLEYTISRIYPEK